jgi:drug/metabolite transporter superfamily protein YnfA
LCYALRVHVPQWLTLAVAGLVILFGSYRLWLALKKPDPAGTERRSLMGGGFYRMSPRMHFAVGIIYLALGGALIATSFGWSPFSSSEPEQTGPKFTKPPVPIEVGPPAKK